MVARAHKTLIWERTRHTLRLRHALREYFPAALAAFDDLDAADTLELLAKAPDPASAARLTLQQIRGRAQTRPPPRHRRQGHAIQAALRGEHLGRLRWSPPPTRPPSGSIAASWPPSTSRSRRCKGRSRPILAGTRTLRSSCPSPGWDRSSAPGCSPSSATTPDRYADAKARKNYAGTSPITRQSGKKKVVLARFVHNDRLVDALMPQAFSPRCGPHPAPAPTTTSNAPAASDHNAALRQLANRLVGILHGCLKTAHPLRRTTAWSHHNQDQQTAA